MKEDTMEWTPKEWGLINLKYIPLFLTWVQILKGIVVWMLLYQSKRSFIINSTWVGPCAPLLFYLKQSLVLF